MQRRFYKRKTSGRSPMLRATKSRWLSLSITTTTTITIITVIIITITATITGGTATIIDRALCRADAEFRALARL